MISLHDFMAAIGYLVSFAGAVTLAFFLVALCVQYCWQKWWDFDSFLRVCDLAKRNGIQLTRKQGGSHD